MKNKYNIIIIGSGLGGLLSGVILSRKGHKVLVLEKNQQIGGSLQTFNRSGCTFSTGMHYMGSLDEGQTLNKIFKYFNLFDGIKYKRLDESGFDIFNIGGKEIKYPIGYDNFRIYMHKKFPDDKEAIDTYINEIKHTIDTQNTYILKYTSNKSKGTGKYLSLNAWDHIKSITKNPELQQAFSALNFVYAGVKEKSPFYIHALINNHFISSSYRIVGSTGQIAIKLANEIKENGGEVLNRNEVSNLEIENNKVIAAISKDGTRYESDHFISDIHPASTMDLINEGDIKKSFRNRMKRKENTLSAFAVHIAVKSGVFKYINANYNYYKQEDVWYASYYSEKKWPEHYFLHCGIPKDGDNYSTCIGLLTHMKFEEVEKWKDFPINKRGDEYKEFKNKKAQQLIDLVCETFPELKDNIISFNVSTPLTYTDYLGTPNGSMYGTLRDYKTPIGSYISPRSKIDNLLFTGQNLNLHGMLGVSLSAILTCGELIGTNDLLNEINAN